MIIEVKMGSVEGVGHRIRAKLREIGLFRPWRMGFVKIMLVGWGQIGPMYAVERVTFQEAAEAA